MLIKKIIEFLFFNLAISCICYGQIELFISTDGNDRNEGNLNEPFYSFDAALQRANELWEKNNTDVIIYFRKGTYRFQSPIVLSPEKIKNGNNSLIISSYDEEKSILSGGIQLNNWFRKIENIYKCPVNDLRFRQVYINGSRAIRAREPNACTYDRLYWDTINQKLIIPKLLQETKIDPKNPTEIIIQKIWTGQIFKINEIKEEGVNLSVDLVPQNRSVFNTRKHQIRDHQSFHLENNYNFLNSEDEWFLDSEAGILYYYFPPVNDFLFNQIEIPVLDHIISISGSDEEKIQNIIIRDLIIELSNFTYPDSMGYYVGQANYVYDLKDAQLEDGALFIKNAANIKILNNDIRKFGGTGITLYSNVQNSSIKNNYIHNGSGNGIVVDWYLKKNKNVDKFCRNISIEGNLITNIGNDYFGSVAIFSGYADSINIEKNVITKVPYTGISIGWGHTENSTNLKNNTIQFNYINEAMSLMSDGGGIYTLSSQPGTIIQKNFIENLIQSKWSWGSNHVYGIYLDKGSDYITVKDNLITNTTENVIINSKRNNTIWLNGLINLNEFKSINNLYNRMDSLVIWINTDQTCYRENYSDIILIPNPVKDEFFIKLSKGIYPEYLNFELFSRNGILVKKGVADQKSNTIYSGKLEDIKTGLYFLKLYIKNTEISLRVFYNPDLN